MAKRGQKIDDKTREQIKAYYAGCGNLRETARKFGVAPSTVKSIAEEAPDDFEQLRTQKREQHINEAYSMLTLSRSYLAQRINMAMKGMPVVQQAINTLGNTLDILSESEELKRDDKLLMKEIARSISVIAGLIDIPFRDVAMYIGIEADKLAKLEELEKKKSSDDDDDDDLGDDFL
ncbi:hypothetical protein P4S95_23420 [Aneurinibacillus aneurinilyticus]|uniref:hypothetical protein n=1 Tax=Aneurinibacillus aneurinilyticus TaxID=1391 RepID=UPI002E21528E|nr:hypothetical protein [Aneurinibacillus aneurinilyticus]